MKFIRTLLALGLFSLAFAGAASASEKAAEKSCGDCCKSEKSSKCEKDGKCDKSGGSCGSKEKK